MLVCQCSGISDRTIRRVVRAGASTVGQVARGCGAGAYCGGCTEAIRDLIQVDAAENADEMGAALTTPANLRA
ncbi:MAG TPA: (2Fe-2S)-binding protein [Myxococcales bacterium]|jgi:bacterioferritin-associated ferredoxin|nr:(2Fe-2S)-binding protein [Myxococcales bacterium]HIL80882.1 (2Fe-2S)-binding protein [Myxococcales bacterium]